MKWNKQLSDKIMTTCFTLPWRRHCYFRLEQCSSTNNQFHSKGVRWGSTGARTMAIYWMLILCHRSSFIKFLTENVQPGLEIIYYKSHKTVYSKTETSYQTTQSHPRWRQSSHTKSSYIHIASMQNKVLFHRQPIHPLNTCPTPLDKWSACCRDLYLTTHNTWNNRQTSMS